MNIIGIKRCAVVFSVCLLIFISAKAWADEIYPSSPPMFTDQELDDILAPVALYPDPLLAQILPASTYPEEVLDAYDWLNSGGSVSEIEWQGWDESVKAVAHYPYVLQMMAGNSNWTADLGDAFLNQPEDVTRSIQRLRWQAKNMGNLENNSRQTIVVVGDDIEILPAQPQYIYVPSYDASVVYEESPYAGSGPFITFGAGMMIGSWLTMDFDWGSHHVIYHGWNRPGWVNHARPYVHVKDLYVQRTRPVINKNWRHDNSHGNPDSYRMAHPGASSGTGMNSRASEIKGRSGTPVSPKKGMVGGQSSFGNFSKENRGVGGPPQEIKGQPARVVPRISPQGQGSAQAGQKTDIQSPAGGKTSPSGSTSERLQRPQTPSVTFGGYRGANEARGQSMRGQASRQSSEKRPSVVREDHAPENKGGPRGNAPEGKQDAGGRPRR